MKKLMMIIVCLFIMIQIKTVYGSDVNNLIDTDEIFEEQEEKLGISKFIEESQRYSEEAFDDFDVGNLYKEALSGSINTNGVLKGIFKVLGSEVQSAFTNLGYILIIIIIHSIIKSISEGLGNKGIGEITYYVQYILIVTLIMTNFSETVILIKDTINSLVGFINCLLPILLALMITTGNLASATVIQPLLLLIITFIGNFITTILLPLILIRYGFRDYIKSI